MFLLECPKNPGLAKGGNLSEALGFPYHIEGLAHHFAIVLPICRSLKDSDMNRTNIPLF